MSSRTFFPVYKNWGEMIEDIAQYDLDTAKELSYAIVHYNMTKEIIQFSNPVAQAMFKGSMLIGMDSAEKSYENGNKGGAPKIELTAEQIIDAYQQCGTWKDTAKFLVVDPKTLKARRDEFGIDKKGKMGKSNSEVFPENNSHFTDTDTNKEEEKWENGKNQEEKETFSQNGSHSVKDMIGTLEWDIKTAEEQKELLGF